VGVTILDSVEVFGRESLNVGVRELLLVSDMLLDAVGMSDCVSLGVGVRVRLSVLEGDHERVMLCVCDLEVVSVGVGDGEALGVDVCDLEVVSVGVGDGEALGVEVYDREVVADGVGDGVGTAAKVCDIEVSVRVGDGVGITVNDSVSPSEALSVDLVGIRRVFVTVRLIQTVFDCENVRVLVNDTIKSHVANGELRLQ